MNVDLPRVSRIVSPIQTGTCHMTPYPGDGNEIEMIEGTLIVIHFICKIKKGRFPMQYYN